MVVFDFGIKEVIISDPVWPTENKEEDFKTYLEFYKGVEGKIPEYGI